MKHLFHTARNIAALAAETRRRTGKSYAGQCADIARLRLSPLRLGATEYYDLGLFKADRYPDVANRRNCYIGRRLSRMLDRQLNAGHARILANDKIITYALLARLGYPIPLLYATYSSTGRRVGDEQQLRTLEAAGVFLKENVGLHPLFIKPAAGTYGRGAMGLEAYRSDGDRFRLLNGNHISSQELLEGFDFKYNKGVLIQEVLRPHPAIAELTGPRISCVRIILLLIDGSPKIHTAFWKVVNGNNMTDNFSLGRSGNLLAAADTDQGGIYNVIADLSPFSVPTTHHPTTGKPLLGFRLPEWQQAKSLCLEAACHFPDLKLQNWDVVLSDRGPVLMELNTEADLNIPQSVTGKPILDEMMCEALAQSGVDISAFALQANRATS
jgi:glutathione synthase/RimK-type ligase-like ATP-grasp enzyme